MRSFLRSLAIGVAALALHAVTFTDAQAQLSSLTPTVSYQGSISKDGATISGEQTMTVRFYADAEGKVLVWEDTFNALLQDGVFSIDLGSQKPLPTSSDIAKGLWVALQIGETPEMRPLSQLSSSLHALSIADKTVTAEKMATDYVASVTVNGEKITGRASELNIVSGEGVDLKFDAASNSVVIGQGTSQMGGKGSEKLNAMTAFGDMVYGGTNNGKDTRLPGNTSTTRKFLSQTGTGSASAIPEWRALGTADIPPLVDLIGTLDVASGGTGATSITNNGIVIGHGTNALTATTLTNGQLLIGSTDAAPTSASITGTADQVIVTNGAGSITLSTPQSIATNSSPTFGSLTLQGKATSAATESEDASGTLTTKGYVDQSISAAAAISAAATAAVAADLDTEILDRMADVNAEETARQLADATLTAGLAAEITRATAAETTLTTNLASEVTNRTADVDAEETARLAADATLTANLASEVTNRTADIDAEEAARLAADATLTTNLASEVSNRIADVDAEEAARTAADNTLTTNLASEVTNRAADVDAEETARLAADATLTTNLADEVTNRAADVDAEETARLAADATLTTNLASEVTNRAADVDAEEAARMAADATLTAGLASEITNRTADVDAEEAARIAADNTLTSNLAEEVTARELDVDAEQTARMAADADLEADLDAEIARATGAEGTLTTNLATEVTRATTAETTLATNLATESSARIAGDNTLTTNLSSEVSRATAAEAALAASISSYDASALHKAGAETVTGTKTFTVDQQFTDGLTITNTPPSGTSMTLVGASSTASSSTPFVVDLIGFKASSSGTDDKSTGLVASASGTGGGTSFGAEISSTRAGAGTSVGATFSATGGSTNIGIIVQNGGAQITGSSSIAGSLNMHSNSITGVASPAAAQDAANKAYVDAETAARIATDATLTTSINNEVVARQAADVTVLAAVNVETSARTLADAALGVRIDDEIADRIADVNAEESARIAAVSAEQTARIADVNLEQARAEAAEAALQATINTNNSNAVHKTGDETINGKKRFTEDIDLEYGQGIGGNVNTDRFNYDGKSLGHYSLNFVNDSWNSSGTAWLSAYAGIKFFSAGTLAGYINADQAKLVGDLTLEQTLNMTNGLINNVANPVSAQDAATKFYVDAETTARISGDNLLSANLANEVSNRVADVNAEEAARIAADNTLTANLSAEVTNRINDVDAEQARATAAENLLSASISSNDGLALHKAGAETVTGTKTFNADQIVATGTKLRFGGVFESTDDVYFSRSHVVHDQVDLVLTLGDNLNDHAPGQADRFIIRSSAEATPVFTASVGNNEVLVDGKFTAGRVVSNGGADMTGDRINNVANPSLAQDAATKAYVDAETAARTADVNAEEAARIADVDAEESARISDVNAEESARTAADNTLTANLASEVTRATTAEDALEASINANDASAVHKSGNETINGTKTFNDDIDLEWGNGIAANVNDRFSYDGKSIGHYSLNFVSDSWNSSGTAWLSAYAGVKFFSAGTLAGYINADQANLVGDLKLEQTLDMTGGLIHNVANPVSAQDAATKSYVDAADASAVKLTGDQTIAGVKSFSGEANVRMLRIDQGGDNSDPITLNRINNSVDDTELQLVIGDNGGNAGNETFTIKASNTPPVFTVDLGNHSAEVSGMFKSGQLILSSGSVASGSTIASNSVTAVNVSSNGASGVATVTLPASGTEGQLLVVGTADPDGVTVTAGSDAYTINSKSALRFIYLGGSWKAEF